MKFYHGCRDGNIKEFKTELSRDGYVYATSSRLIALTYIARVFPNMFKTEKDKEVFIEIVPNFFEDTIKGCSGYVYLMENKKNFIPINQDKNCAHSNSFKIKENVKVVSVEYIEDVYQELNKYIESGQLIIRKFETLSQEEIEKHIDAILKIDNEMHNKLTNNRVDLIKEYLNKKGK